MMFYRQFCPYHDNYFVIVIAPQKLLQDIVADQPACSIKNCFFHFLRRLQGYDYFPNSAASFNLTVSSIYVIESKRLAYIVIAWFTTIPTIPRNQIAKSTNMQENYTLVKFPLQSEKAQMLLELTLSNFPTGVVYLQNGYCNCMDTGWTFLR